MSRLTRANAAVAAIDVFMICEDEALAPAQLKLFKDFESTKNQHKKDTDTYYKTYYDPNKTYPQNVTLSSTGGPTPAPVGVPMAPVVNGTKLATTRTPTPVQSNQKPVQTLPRIISVSGAQPQRATVANGIPSTRLVISQPNSVAPSPRIQSVTSLNPQAQAQSRSFVQMPVTGNSNVQSTMVNINGQNIRLLVTPQMQSQIQSGARLVFSTGGTQVTTTPAMVASNSSGPRIMYTTTGQRVIQPPVPQAKKTVPPAVQTPLQQQQKTLPRYQQPQPAQKTTPPAQPAKRPAPAAANASAAKRQKATDPKDLQKENDHYGFKKGKKKYDDDTTSQPKFSCHHCNRRIASNIRFMQHIKSHLEKERQHTFSLNDMINCEHCYKRFRTPFERQCHIEKFHMKTDFVCGVCELSFENNKTLVQHLEEKHTALQMPYICKVCDYRTSVYDDIIVHFSQTHLGSKSLLCHFCLRVVKTAKDFSRHCLKHLTISIRNGSHRCKSCKLMFLSYSELKEHSDKDHVRFVKSKRDGVPSKTASKTLTVPPAAQTTAATNNPVPNSVPPATLTVRMPAFKKKSSTPQTSFTEYKDLFQPYDLVKPSGPVWCCECGARVFDPKVHFKKCMQCSNCPFVTFCGETYANHMIVFHSTRKPPTAHPITKVKRKNGRVVLTCKRCQFTTKIPSMMAWHVASACTGGISFMSFQRMIYPAKEKESEKVAEAEEIVLLSDEETEPLKIRVPKKVVTPIVVSELANKQGKQRGVQSDGNSQTGSIASQSASNENSQDSVGSSHPSTSNGNSQSSFAVSLSNSSQQDEDTYTPIGSALAELQKEPMDTSDSLVNSKKPDKAAVQLNGQLEKKSQETQG